MRRMREIIGIPVISVKTGERFGWVKDVVFNDKSNKVVGVILEKDSLLNRSIGGLSRESIIAVSKDSLTVDKPEIREITGSCWSQKVGSSVFDGKGELKGTVGDVFVDDEMKNVLGYEISDGLFSDLFQGRGAIFEENILAEGEDIIVVEGRSLS